jgi:hypothetical protein
VADATARLPKLHPHRRAPHPKTGSNEGRTQGDPRPDRRQTRVPTVSTGRSQGLQRRMEALHNRQGCRVFRDAREGHCKRESYADNQTFHRDTSDLLYNTVHG